VDIAFHEVGECGVYQAMARHRGDAAERLGNDAYTKMALPTGRSSMTRMQVAFILYDELHGGKFLAQPPAYL
jgi:hypothetical protein